MEVINRSSELQRYHGRREQLVKCHTCGEEVKYFQLANHRKLNHKAVQHCEYCNVDVRDMRAHRRGSKHRKRAPKHEQILLDLKARCDSENDTVDVWIVSRDGEVRRSSRLLAVSDLTSEVLDRLLEGRDPSTDRKFSPNEVEFGLVVYPFSLAEVDQKCDVTLLSERELYDGAVQICCNVDAPEGMEPYAVELMCW